MHTWQLRDAKQRFSEVVRAAETEEPQIITRRGQNVAVIIEYAGYQSLVTEPTDFKSFLESAPIPEDFKFPEREDLSGAGAVNVAAPTNTSRPRPRLTR